MIIHLIVELRKKTWYQISQYFPEPYKFFWENINVKDHLSNYVIKLELKEARGTDASNFALKANLVRWKTEVDKIEVSKLKTDPVDLSKLSHLVNNDFVKIALCNKLVAKVNNIDTSGFVLKTKYSTGKSDLMLR